MTVIGTLRRRVLFLGFLARHGSLTLVVDFVRRHLWSDDVALGLRRDMTVSFTPPDATVSISISPIRDGDIPALLDVHSPDVPTGEIIDRLTRRRMLDGGLMRCYVAVTEDDQPCYMQWIIGPAEHDRMVAIFNETFPRLGQDERLLEGAFTPEPFRGKKIMPAAMARIAGIAADGDVRWVITFVQKDNVPSLKGCARAGFSPYLTRSERWRLFRQTVMFSPRSPAPDGPA